MGPTTQRKPATRAGVRAVRLRRDDVGAGPESLVDPTALLGAERPARAQPGVRPSRPAPTLRRHGLLPRDLMELLPRWLPGPGHAPLATGPMVGSPASPTVPGPTGLPRPGWWDTATAVVVISTGAVVGAGAGHRVGRALGQAGRSGR